MSFIQKREAPRYRSPFTGNTTHWRVNVTINKKLLVEHSPASFR
jgi:hypothetical protein